MNKKIMSLRSIAITGNVLFILWILFNGMDSGWKGTWIQVIAFVSLIALLLLNTYFLLKKSS